MLANFSAIWNIVIVKIFLIPLNRQTHAVIPTKIEQHPPLNQSKHYRTSIMQCSKLQHRGCTLWTDWSATTGLTKTLGFEWPALWFGEPIVIQDHMQGLEVLPACGVILNDSEGLKFRTIISLILSIFIVQELLTIDNNISSLLVIKHAICSLSQSSFIASAASLGHFQQAIMSLCCDKQLTVPPFTSSGVITSCMFFCWPAIKGTADYFDHQSLII